MLDASAFQLRDFLPFPGEERRQLLVSIDFAQLNVPEGDEATTSVKQTVVIAFHLSLRVAWALSTLGMPASRDGAARRFWCTRIDSRCSRHLRSGGLFGDATDA